MVHTGHKHSQKPRQEEREQQQREHFTQDFQESSKESHVSMRLQLNGKPKEPTNCRQQIRQ